MGAVTNESQEQVLQMTEFILSEAKDRAEEITAKALQEFSVEKQKLVNQTKEKIRQEFVNKTKKQETAQAIARSSAINKSRLRKIQVREEQLTKLSHETQGQLSSSLDSSDKLKPFITKLIVQGLLMLLEDTVEVRCRACDDTVVRSCLGDAANMYADIVKRESGATRSVKLALDTKVKLPPAPEAAGEHEKSCLGGVVLACQNGSITIDNTIDSRLNLVLEQAKPTIRKLLFSH